MWPPSKLHLVMMKLALALALALFFSALFALESGCADWSVAALAFAGSAMWLLAMHFGVMFDIYNTRNV